MNLNGTTERVHSFLQALSLAILLVLGGGSAEQVEGRPKLVPARGKVTYKGQPLDGATVVFSPAEHQYAAAAKSNENGLFQLMSFGTSPGAVPGTYSVTVKKFTFTTTPKGEELEVQLLPARYGAAETSGLNATVVDEQTNEFEFTLSD